jgi:signal transduction histidine kinase
MSSVTRAIGTGSARHSLALPPEIRSAGKRRTMRHDAPASRTASILESMAHHVAVMDRDGTIQSVTATRNDVPFNLEAFRSIQPGGNYYEACRLAAADAGVDVVALREGIETVARQHAPLYQAMLRFSADGGEQWVLLSARPLSRPSGGAIVAHIRVTPQTSVRQHGVALEISPKLAVAQEEERSRIARELHDDLGQQTALLAAKISAVARARNLPSARRLLADANRHVQELAVSIHNLSHQLHPPRLKLLGLVKTLAAMCRDVSKQRQVRIRFHSSGVPADVPERIALCVCRVAQEAVQNAVKHSGSPAIDVELIGGAGQLTLRIADRGRGFDPRCIQTDGLGLLTMRERVELTGGRFAIDSAPSAGTRIDVVLPLS